MKKIVVIEDFIVRNGQLRKFLEFEKDGWKVEFVKDHPEIDNHEDFSKMFLQFEQYGPDSLPPNKEMVEAMKDAEIVVSHISPIHSLAIKGAENLKAICIMRSGIENVNKETVREKHVPVINTPGRLAVPVSEFTVGLMIAEMKNIARSHQKVFNHDFDKTFVNSEYSYNLYGRKVGLIGCGMVGKRVAKILKAFDAEVLIYDPYLEEEQIRELGCEPVSLDELCEQSDVVSVHYRLTEETKGMIGRAQFERMKPNCCFINTARAGLVEEEALIKALQSKKIGGAALDVFHQEPLPDNHPFFKMNNVTLTSHLAGTSADVLDVTYGIMAETLKKYMETGQWEHIVI